MAKWAEPSFPAFRRALSPMESFGQSSRREMESNMCKQAFLETPGRHSASFFRPKAPFQIRFDLIVESGPLCRSNAKDGREGGACNLSRLDSLYQRQVCHRVSFLYALLFLDSALGCFSTCLCSLFQPFELFLSILSPCQ